MKLKPLLKVINTRGRKREARRWLKDLDERCAALGPSATGHDLWFEAFEDLKDRDPVLSAAVMEVMWANMGVGTSDKKWWVKERRRQEKLSRIWWRARQLRVQHGARAKVA